MLTAWTLPVLLIVVLVYQPASAQRDWEQVERGESISHSMAIKHIQIKTNSEDGSNDKLFLKLYSGKGIRVTGIAIYFSKNPKYRITNCMRSETRSDLITWPSEQIKIWTIQYLRDDSFFPRIRIRCNNELVLDFQTSSLTCDEDGWRNSLALEVKKIRFDSDDSASDRYRPYLGNCRPIEFREKADPSSAPRCIEPQFGDSDPIPIVISSSCGGVKQDFCETGEGAFQHYSSKLCIQPGIDSNNLVLGNNCMDDGARFSYDATTKSYRHVASDKCWKPRSISSSGPLTIVLANNACSDRYSFTRPEEIHDTVSCKSKLVLGEDCKCLHALGNDRHYKKFYSKLKSDPGSDVWKDCQKYTQQCCKDLLKDKIACWAAPWGTGGLSKCKCHNNKCHMDRPDKSIKRSCARAITNCQHVRGCIDADD